MLHAPGFRSSARLRITDRSAIGTPLPFASRLRSETKENVVGEHDNLARLRKVREARCYESTSNIVERIYRIVQNDRRVGCIKAGFVKKAARRGCGPLAFAEHARQSDLLACPNEFRLMKQRPFVRSCPRNGYTLQAEPICFPSKRVADHLCDALFREF